MKKSFLVLAMTVVALCFSLMPAGMAHAVRQNEVVLEWTAPTTNSDGTVLTDLGGYRMYLSRSQGGPYTLLVNLPVAPTEYDAVIKGDPGDEGKTVRYYFVATAIDDKTPPNESAYSNEVYKDLTFPMVAPAAVILRIRAE